LQNSSLSMWIFDLLHLRSLLSTL